MFRCFLAFVILASLAGCNAAVKDVFEMSGDSGQEFISIVKVTRPGVYSIGFASWGESDSGAVQAWLSNKDGVQIERSEPNKTVGLFMRIMVNGEARTAHVRHIGSAELKPGRYELGFKKTEDNTGEEGFVIFYRNEPKT